jgi:ribosomal protein S18 acetylase RimI-like enzyme
VTTPAVSLAHGYTLHRATLLDVRALYRLEAVIFPRDAYPHFDLALMFLWPGIINLKVTTPGGAMAAFASCSRGLSPERGWIITLGVAPDHQERGLGGYLLDMCEKRLKRPVVLLTVREGNNPAIRLYQRAGYQTVERKWGYYRDGETGLVMEKRM